MSYGLLLEDPSGYSDRPFADISYEVQFSAGVEKFIFSVEDSIGKSCERTQHFFYTRISGSAARLYYAFSATLSILLSLRVKT